MEWTIAMLIGALIKIGITKSKILRNKGLLYLFIPLEDIRTMNHMVQTCYFWGLFLCTIHKSYATVT